MQKPKGYDEASAGFEVTPIKPGAHYGKILQVSEKTVSNGKNQIVVLFDFSDQDEQKGLFNTQFKNDSRTPKKWPFLGTKYIWVNDYNDPNKTSSQFKRFCSCVEHSNGYKIQWGGDDWGQQFKNKKIGIVFGEVENEYEGRIYKRVEPRWFCSIDSVPTTNIPSPKLLPVLQRPVPKTDANGFMELPNTGDDVIPF